MKKLFGVVCATITPMLPDESLDMESADNLYRHLARQGVHCLYPNGTNGESLSLTHEERCRLGTACLNAAQERCVVYLQCGAATVRETAQNIRFARESRADGVGVMTPVFFPVDEAGLEEYYDSMLKEADGLPAYVYNIPSRTGNDVSAALLGRLMPAHQNLYGIKFSSPDLLRLSDYVQCCPGREVGVLIGCDSLALCCMSLGGAGWVSGPAAVFAKRFVRLYREIERGDVAAASVTQKRIAALGAGMAGMPEIPAIKHMLVKRGIIAHDTCRAPLRALSAEEKTRLDRLLAQYMAQEQCREERVP